MGRIGSATIVVCSANGAGRLDLCLSRIRALEPPPGVEVEVIVVDNGSTDDTALVIEDHRCRSPRPFRHLTEPRRGLSRARNRGLRAASGDIVACTDDDCAVAPDWITALVSAFEQHPEAAVLGGRVELFDPGDRPVTIKGTKHAQVLDAPDRLEGFLHGCNVAFRREVFEQVGGFDIRLGAGALAPSGEDTDLVFRALRAGLGVHYAPDAVVFHNHGRKTKADEQARRRIYRIGAGARRLKHVLKGDRGMTAFVLRDAYDRLCRVWSPGDDPGDRWKAMAELSDHALGGLIFLLLWPLPSGTRVPLGSGARRTRIEPVPPAAGRARNGAR